MEFVRKVLRDIRRGENIELYVAMAMAIVLIALDMANVNIQEQLASLTLGVLALLALSILGNRTHVESLRQMMVKERSPFLHEFPADRQIDIEQATDMLFLGINLAGTVRSHYHGFDTKLDGKCRIRALVMDPHGDGLDMSLRRANRPIRRESASEVILESLDSLCALKAQARDPDMLEIRVLDYPLQFGADMLDADSIRGVIYIREYNHKMPASEIPKFVLHTQDEAWFQFYRSQIETLWDSATPWVCQQNR